MAGKGKVGRPTDYNLEIATTLCNRISGIGQDKPRSVRSVCSDDDMPSLDAFFKWIAKYREFNDQYARAKEIQMEFYADEINTIADDDSKDFQIDPDGKVRSDNTAVNRARLRVDSRKWLMSKLAPKKYGDTQKHEHSGPEGGPIPVINIGLTKPDPSKS